MYISSRNFYIRSLEERDKEFIKYVEETRPWNRAFDNTEDVFNYRLFDDMWNNYIEAKESWCIFNKDNQFYGVIHIDRESETECEIYFQMLPDVDIKGIGSELLNKFLEALNEVYGIEEFEVSLWDENDISKSIFEEAGYEFDEEYLEISL